MSRCTSCSRIWIAVLAPWSIMPCSSALRSLSSCCSDVRSAAVCVCFSSEPEVRCSLTGRVIFAASWACYTVMSLTAAAAGPAIWIVMASKHNGSMRDCTFRQTFIFILKIRFDLFSAILARLFTGVLREFFPEKHYPGKYGQTAPAQPSQAWR